jgi:DNA-binding Lrp family transcriptional regulator
MCDVTETALDRRIILATQAGLPLDPQPYQRIAEQLGVTAETVMARLAVMQADGRLRRIAAVPNHYRLGYTANGMSVWDIPDEVVDTIGEQVGRLDFVSHCYRRPRYLPEWPYNFFAMLHAHNRDEVLAQAAQIAGLMGDACHGHDILFSTRILKKTGMRFRE